MFLRFGARLVSNGDVQEVTTGDGSIKDDIERARASDTVFPYPADDVAKSKSDRGIIESYWEGKWDGSVQRPTFIFASNDPTKPKFELRTRRKTLGFNVNFSALEKDERGAAAQIADQADRCDLFPWFARLFLQRDISLPDQSDRLADARNVFAERYADAEKEPPEYVPLEKPASRNTTRDDGSGSARCPTGCVNWISRTTGVLSLISQRIWISSSAGSSRRERQPTSGRVFMGRRFSLKGKQVPELDR